MHVRSHLLLASSVLAAAFTGCASVQSTSLTANQASPGLVYRLPKKLISVSYVVPDDGKAGTTSIAASAAVPDMETRYIANFSRNLLGKNALEIGIGPNGLLTSSKVTTTSQLEQVLTNIAGAAGTVTALGAMEAVNKTPLVPLCTAKGTYATSYPLAELTQTGGQKFCDMVISATPLAGTPKGIKVALEGSQQSGYFYRTMVPVVVSVEYSRLARSKESVVVLLPDTDSIEFLPVERTLFANNSAEFAFADGVPTLYKQDSDGELFALSKLPAAVLSAYFTAIGSAFTVRGTNTTNEALLLAKLDALALQRQRSIACEKAIIAGDAAAMLAQCKPS